MSLNDTPRANRLHIGIFGSTNSGKSSLINALTGQDTALVSEIAGTTTDPVYKSMEIHGIGPCVFIDTAGFDDTGSLGAMRIERTREAVKKTDMALMVFSAAPDDTELSWAKDLNSEKIPVIPVLNLRADQTVCPGNPKTFQEASVKAIQEGIGMAPVIVNAKTGEGIPVLRQAMIRALPSDYEAQSITGGLAKQGDIVLLVMPQDIQAPKGRLILPQVQTIRELLDKKCSVLSCTTDMLEPTLAVLKDAPDLIITDSQVFKTVYEKKPEKSRLTSFSVLFAGYKGDIDYFANSVRAIDALTPESKVLIAEACTHAPLAEDIGREKIPAMLRKKVGPSLTVDIVSGPDFPKDLSPYNLIIHCGACMFNRKYVLSRIEGARASHVPMTNYGITIAYLSGILDKIDLKA